MLKKVAILANGGDVAGFNAVIRGIVKTAENNGIECYGFIDGYNGLLKNDYVLLSTAENGNAEGILPKGGSIIGSSTNANVFNYKVINENGEVEYKDFEKLKYFCKIKDIKIINVQYLENIIVQMEIKSNQKFLFDTFENINFNPIKCKIIQEKYI